MTSSSHPAEHARRRPDHPAVIIGETGEVLSYRQLDDRSMQVSQLLRSWDIRIGGSVALLADNHRSFLEIVWGAQRSGVYLTPISFHLTASEVGYIAADCGASVLFVARARTGMIADLRKRLPALRIVSLDEPISGCAHYEEEVRTQPTQPIADQAAGTDMIYTSGTTGMPKGVRRPLSQKLFGEVPQRFLHYATLGWNEDTVQLSAGPLYHSSPLHSSMITQFFGGTTVVPGRFDAECTLAMIERYGVTHANFVPTHFIRMLRLPEQVRCAYDLSSLQLVLHGAAPCPPEVKRQMMDWLGPIVMEFYGGSEGIGGAFISGTEWLGHPGSVGKSVPSAAHILDQHTGRELPPGEVGTIFFENPPDFSYHHAPEKTAAMLSPQGWATLGDIGRIDADGYLYVEDRGTNLIISGGVNIYPREAEDRLTQHPAVLDAAVFGVPSVEFGEDVHAVIELIPGLEGTSELTATLQSFCREELANFKCPKTIEFTPRLPRDENGKLYKGLLRDAARQRAQTPISLTTP